jgi:hypothetical protein
MFGAGCLPTNKDCVHEVLDVGNVTHEDKCLGLPTLIGRMSKEKFKTTKGEIIQTCHKLGKKVYVHGSKRSAN